MKVAIGMQKQLSELVNVRFVGVVLLSITICSVSMAEVPVTRSISTLPVSNGFGAAMLDLETKRVTHWREHLYASEEPRLDDQGNEVWKDGHPQDVPTRDVLYDMYFGLRIGDKQSWLTSDSLDADKSGYKPVSDAEGPASSVAIMRQTRGELQLTTHLLAPMSMNRSSIVLALEVHNTSASASEPVTAFSLHNYHLGFGRPGVGQDIGQQAETVVFDDSAGKADFIERGFAGVIVTRPLSLPERHGASNAASAMSQSIFEIVNNPSGGDLPNHQGTGATADGWVTGYQFNLGVLAPGERKWVGVVAAHHGDPFADATLKKELDDYRSSRTAEELVAAELKMDATFLDALTMPSSMSEQDRTLYRQSAIMLRMGQVRESKAFLRPWFDKDGEPRKTRFGVNLDDPPATLPAEVSHRGKGAVIASLPPGQWTVPWIRDGAYAVAAMAASGMHEQARDGLKFYLDAEGGRFRDWQELAPYNMPAYQISLVRYYGFGVEETDFNAFGPNLEFDGFGLFLWALRRYEDLSGDTSLREAYWPAISGRIADAIVGLVQDDTGLMAADSSIWETHWNGRQRQWSYTNITAVRGLCDAAALAERQGDAALSALYKDKALALRQAIATRLTDSAGGLASNFEELQSGQGYWDAAVIDAIAMDLFEPNGRIANATFAGLDDALSVPAGAGWARNDDRFDHPGAEDLSPWGSEYDSGEWVITDLRGAVAASRAGDTKRASRLRDWVSNQAAANFFEVAEVFDEGKGTYKFNAPMIGFGAGAFILAQHARAASVEAACGSYFDEGANSSSSASAGGGADPGPLPTEDASSCACTVAGRPSSGAWWSIALLGVLFAARRRAGLTA